jgi:predicted nucleic acid-binding protein
MRYLADTSIWSWALGGRRRDITWKLSDRIDRSEVATCYPVVIEHQHHARTGHELDMRFEEIFEPLHWLSSGEAAWGRALAVQRSLAHVGHGHHRRKAMDYVIAATAELAGPDVVLWAFDRDMQVICEHTGQPCELETTEPDN